MYPNRRITSGAREGLLRKLDLGFCRARSFGFSFSGTPRLGAHFRQVRDEDVTQLFGLACESVEARELGTTHIFLGVVAAVWGAGFQTVVDHASDLCAVAVNACAGHKRALILR